MEVICNSEHHPMGWHGGASLHLLRQGLPKMNRWGQAAIKSNPRYCLGSGTAACSTPVLPGSGTDGCRRLVHCFQASFLPDILPSQLQGWCVNLTHLLDLSLGLESKR